MEDLLVAKSGLVLPDGSVHLGKDQAEEYSVEEESLKDALSTIDRLKMGDQFWVRDIRYQVVAIQQDSIIIAPVGLASRAMRQLRRSISRPRKGKQ